MRGSLQDQLLQSGIATEDQLKKNKPAPKSRHKGKSAGKPNKSGDKKRYSGTKTKPAAHSRNKPTQVKATPEVAPALGKALRMEIKQLLKLNKLNDKAGEIPYNYVIAGQVKRFYINEKQQIELKASKLVIVNWNTISYLISTEAEQDLRKLHPTIEVASVESAPSPSQAADKKDDNDPYSDYAIPDDLSW